MVWLDGRVDLASQALLLVLAAALAAVGWPPWLSLLACPSAVLAFNFFFVPPRGSFSVHLRQHALLLATMLAVSVVVAVLVAQQRRLALRAQRLVRQSEQLRRLGETLREADEPRERVAMVQEALAEGCGHPVALLLPHEVGVDQAGPTLPDPSPGADVLGEPTADELTGLWLCSRQGQAMGPGTGRHEDQPAWYVPMRGRSGAYGAALLPLSAWPSQPSGALRVLSGAAPGLANAGDLARELAHAQALCDQAGVALERAAALRAATASREAAQAQALRNTLLAAISHDHRTPLATILGAAGSLHDQGDRLGPAQRQRLAATIVDEAAQLTRLTDNTLQLARLGAGALAIRRDWESAEEIVGTVLRRTRQRDPGRRLRARVQPDLPLLQVDALLMVQLLDNLVDNALKHGGDAGPVEIVARRSGDEIVLAVRDRGSGVPLALRERIFETFQRGPSAALRGAGVGLAVCRAIAHAHGGELRLRARSHGGSSFEFVLPVQDQPGPGDPPREAALP
jgi:two-component system sensor histidine kinase KdpD